MFCRTCGATLKDDARYCYYCGRIQSPEATTPFPDKVRAIAKKAGSSPLFLIATICFTLVQVLGVFSLFFTGDALGLSSLFAEVGADPELLPSLEIYTLVGGLIGMLPSFVITLGLWLTYGSCASRKPKANTAGLTMIFVVSLIQLVLSCLVLLVAALVVIVLTLELIPATANDVMFTRTVLGISLGALLVVFAFVLLWYIKVCTTITNIRDTLKTGVPNRRVSRFVGVLCFISGVMLVLLGVGNLMMGLAILLPSAFLSALSNLLTAASQILFGVLIFSYRSKMNDLETEERMNTFKTLSYAAPYTSPVYIPPQPAEEETE